MPARKEKVKKYETPFSLKKLLETLCNEKADALILTCGSPPVLKTGKSLRPIGDIALKLEDTEALVYCVLSQNQKDRFHEEWEIDFSFGILGMARFRANASQQRGAITAVFHRIPFELPTYQEIAGPKELLPLIDGLKGLVIVTGPIGGGKSSFVSAMIDYVNTNHQCHIITIEDPIEFLFRHKKSIVEQKQVGSDTKSFETALKYVLRQSPDVVVLNELHNSDIVDNTLTIAEAGCLCIVQTYAPYAVSALEKYVGIFPQDRHDIIRKRLASILVFVVATRLHVHSETKQRCFAYEVLINNEEVAALIRAGDFAKIQQHVEPALASSIEILKR